MARERALVAIDWPTFFIDSQLGKGHVVMFSIRPFWRWQTQGTFIMGFNALMNWNDLAANGK